jgi:Zn finger protein HypA/HybF involved in hydrogenase expression
MQRRRLLEARRAQRALLAPDLVRCACRNCGSHVQAVVLKQTVSGQCTTCGSYDIVLLSACERRPR